MTRFARTQARGLAVGVASLAGSQLAFALDAQLVTQVSRDGIYWHDRLDAYPSEQITVRVQVRFANLGTTDPWGLGSIITQPTLSGWTPGDVRLPFSTPDGSGVDELRNEQYGRVAPFATSGMRTDNASGLLTSFVDPNGVLRFAGANAITMTTNLTWGVSSGQLPPAIAGTSFRWGQSALVFRYAIHLDPVLMSERSLVASVPIESVVQRRASAYFCWNCTATLLADVRSDTIFPATIHVVPAASSAVALAGAIQFLMRRRRSGRASWPGLS